MKRYRVFQVDAFTRERFRGNPAGVVANADGLSEGQMQEIARELNNSETAFVLSPCGSDHDVWIRFFTPTTEVPICGHATISAHYVRAREMGLGDAVVRQRTGAGILPVEVVREDDDHRIVMTQGEVELGPVLTGEERDTLLAALGLGEDDLDPALPVQAVSTGHAKVMVGIREVARLDALQPDLAALAELSGRIGLNGFHVFTLDSPEPGVLAHGRMFAPAIGIPEDPVTGNANGPLGALLVQHARVPHDGRRLRFRARQGVAMGRPGTVEVMVDIDGGRPFRVRVAGEAVVVFHAEIEL
jgi:PhzF family phenazine biosynthesis protein